jgi:hypothetical protein
VGARGVVCVGVCDWLAGASNRAPISLTSVCVYIYIYKRNVCRKVKMTTNLKQMKCNNLKSGYKLIQ